MGSFLLELYMELGASLATFKNAQDFLSESSRRPGKWVDRSSTCLCQWPESFGSLVLLYLTGDKSNAVSAHRARIGKSPLSAVNDGVPRLERQLV
jgi:hypothetical protein